MKRAHKSWKRMAGLLTLLLVLAIGLGSDRFAIVSLADNQCKVISDGGAKIRQEASTSSAMVASAAQNETLTIKSQTTDAEGMIWYSIATSNGTTGYIRSDLVEVAEGTTIANQVPSTTENNTSTTTTASNVTAVNPVSATVKGGGSTGVRVRESASTDGSIVTKASDGLALTVVGQADGTDGKVWYQVNFIADGKEYTGFIRSDYISLDGEVTPYTEPTNEPTGDEGQEDTPQEPVVEHKDYETQLQGDTWMLIDNVNQKQYSISNLMDAAETNLKLYEESQGTIKSQKVTIIVMVILLVLVAGAGTIVILRMKEVMDSAYMEQAEQEVVRRRSADRPQTPVRTGERRPGADSPQGARPQGAGQGAKPQGTAQGARPGEPERRTGGEERGETPAPGWKSKNFMTDDDEFEFEFLNMDSDEEV